MVHLIRELEGRYAFRFPGGYETDWDYARKILRNFSLDSETGAGGWTWIRQVHIECVIYGSDDFHHVGRKRGVDAADVEFIVEMLMQSAYRAPFSEERYSEDAPFPELVNRKRMRFVS